MGTTLVEHQKMPKDSLEAYFVSKPVPCPRGSAQQMQFSEYFKVLKF